VDLEGLSLTGPRFIVAFANGREFGNGAVLSATADPSDGWLDAVVAADGSMWQHLWRARRLLFRQARPARGIERRRVRTASVSGPRLVCHVDGETFETSGRLDVRILPGALLVRGCSLGVPTSRGG
jgi:diacylglycerol kinase family enzyme